MVLLHKFFLRMMPSLLQFLHPPLGIHLRPSGTQGLTLTALNIDNSPVGLLIYNNRVDDPTVCPNRFPKTVESRVVPFRRRLSSTQSETHLYSADVAPVHFNELGYPRVRDIQLDLTDRKVLGVTSRQSTIRS